MEHCTRGPALLARRMAARRDMALKYSARQDDDAATGASGAGPFSALPTPSAAELAQPATARPEIVNLSDWRRECFTLPPAEAREVARAWLARYPAARWRSEIENWRIVGDDLVQFTVRRLPQEV